MTIPSLSSHQVPVACVRLPSGSVTPTPIQAGVDSHRIRFRIQSTPNITEVSTVVGASDGKCTKPAEVLEDLRPKLLEACKNGACLVSFGGRSSFDRITARSNEPLRSNSSSLIEQIRALSPTQFSDLKLSESITLKAVSINPQCELGGMSFISGTLTFQRKGELSQHVVEFREFYPEYDGRSLSASSLLAALDQLPAESAQPALDSHALHQNALMQFYSARGIGRSASLAVLYSFKKMCVEEAGFPPNEVSYCLDRLIQQGRFQRSKHFVNTVAQQEELLSACLEINRRVLASQVKIQDVSSTCMEGHISGVTQSSPTGPVTSPALQVKNISAVIQDLSTRVVQLGKHPATLPYMPIQPYGITAIARNADFRFPRLNVDQAKMVAADVIWCGFYGDALGSELESRTYPERKDILLDRLAYPGEFAFIQAVPDAAYRDKQLIDQLRKNNHRSSRGPIHGATDDTQQGALSAIAKTRWILNEGKDLNQLAGEVMWAFHKPAFPANGVTRYKEFEIRGGANTLYMCKFATDTRANWKDVAIGEVRLIKNAHCQVVGIEKLDVRAGGAGNGAMMRIGYDLLPLLSTNATTQDLIEQALISNQVTHPSSFSAVASVGQIVMMARCINLRLEADKRPDKRLVVPANFFIDTYYEVAKALEHPYQTFGLLNRFSCVPEKVKHQCSIDDWRAHRLPSEFLKCALHDNESIRLGSVEQALIDSKDLDNTSASVDSVLQRWSSNSYLGATFPSIVFLLERFGRNNPALAVNMAALVTKDSDTCATIIAQLMGALHGSDWVGRELAMCIDTTGQPTFDPNLGGGFSVSDFIDHMGKFYLQYATQGRLEAMR